MSSKFDCAVVGDWHLAFVTAACLASCGNRTILVNPNSTEKPWKQFPELSLNEPGLSEMIQEARSKNLLTYSNQLLDGWSTDIVWLAIDTPVNDRDEADVQPLLRVAKQASETKFTGVFAISSQIPLGFCSLLTSEYGLNVAYIPENLRLGKGIETFRNADRTVIGAASGEIHVRIEHLLKEFQTVFFRCDQVTSEMIKHATNCFLATSISFANELARVGEKMGVDNRKVAEALKLDQRIGKLAYVAPGLGFAGGTLPRDLRILQELGKRLKVPTSLVDAVLNINDSTAQAVADSVCTYLEDPRGKKILILGYSYKPEIDTLRRSGSVELAKALRGKGIAILGYDPVMNQRDLSELQGIIDHRNDLRDINESPDGIVVMTARPQFQNLDWESWAQQIQLRQRQRQRPTLLLDTTSKQDPIRLMRAGFAFKALWQPTQY